MKLDRFRYSVTSQFGEDGLLAYLIDAYPTVPRICLEVGAGDGVRLSNTHRLWATLGWRALLIEQDATKLSGRFGHLPNVSIVETTITARGESSLDAIAHRMGFPAEIGIASIDIDSFDYWVFARLEYLKPVIAVIEFNPRIPAHIDYCDPEGIALLRHSAKAMARLAAEKGYRVVACTGPNAVLVNEATIATNPTAVPDLSIEELFDHAYAKRFSKTLVGAQHVTDLPIYTRRPTFLMRSYGQLHYTWLTLKKRTANTSRGMVHSISPELRSHVERSGLWT